MSFPTQGLPSPRTPWHMWGTSQTLVIPANGERATQQLARVNYKRPETWSFLFAVRFIEGFTQLAGNVDVFLDFDVYVGVGRSVVLLGDEQNLETTGFASFDFRWAFGVTPPRGYIKWTTSVTSPPMSDIQGGPEQLVQWLPAEDLQCRVRGKVDAIGAAPGDQVTVEVHSYFAPRTHVRPDWFGDAPDDTLFRGAEVGGS